jgi:hypothetical protein
MKLNYMTATIYFEMNWRGNGASLTFLLFLIFPVPVCAITASGVPGGTFVSMNRFSTLCV